MIRITAVHGPALALVLLLGVPRTGNTADIARSQARADTLPTAVAEAASQGRYWRATRLLDEHLATSSDTAASTVLAAARLRAGWGDWDGVARLLRDRDWLEREAGGAGWELLGRARIATGRTAEGARALRRYLEQATGDRDRAVALLRLGSALAEEDSTAAALEAYGRAAELIPWFADWAALFAVRAAAAGGDTSAVRTGLAAAGPLAAGQGWAYRLGAAREAGDTMAAREIALATARSTGSATTRSAAWAELGTMRLAAGDTARARQAFVEAMSAPGAAGAVTGARLLTELGPSTDEWRQIGDIYARHGNPTRAESAYRTFLEAGAGDADTRQRIRLAMGRALFNAGRYDAAAEELLSLAETSSSARVGAQALYLAGRAQYRAGRGGDGQRTLAQLPERFPDQPAVTRGVYLLADLKHDDLEVAEARRYYRIAAEASPGLNEAGLSLMRLGGLAFLEEDYAEAVSIFEEYRRLHPNGRRWNQATYWSARGHTALGEPDSARARLRALRARDPISYYGMRAAELLDEPLLPAGTAAAAGGPELSTQLRRVDLLADLDRRSDLVREVERLREEAESDRTAAFALAEALNARGHTLTAIGMGWDLYRAGAPRDRRLLRIMFPFPYRDLVIPEALARDLDPYLVAGLIRQESAFNPSVTSRAGAIGLMQIMPETGRALAREVGLVGFEPELLKQPEVNVHLGTRYLAEMLDRYGHSLPLVLSAYNAGPTRAAVWREFPEARDDELLTERVPFGETRDYIRSVLLHRALYRALYPDADGGA